MSQVSNRNLARLRATMMVAERAGHRRNSAVLKSRLQGRTLEGLLTGIHPEKLELSPGHEVALLARARLEQGSGDVTRLEEILASIEEG